MLPQKLDKLRQFSITELL